MDYELPSDSGAVRSLVARARALEGGHRSAGALGDVRPSVRRRSLGVTLGKLERLAAHEAHTAVGARHRGRVPARGGEKE